MPGNMLLSKVRIITHAQIVRMQIGVQVCAPHITNFCVMCVRVGAKIVGLMMLNAKKQAVIQG